MKQTIVTRKQLIFNQGVTGTKCANTREGSVITDLIAENQQVLNQAIDYVESSGITTQSTGNILPKLTGNKHAG